MGPVHTHRSRWGTGVLPCKDCIQPSSTSCWVVELVERGGGLLKWSEANVAWAEDPSGATGTCQWARNSPAVVWVDMATTGAKTSAWGRSASPLNPSRPTLNQSQVLFDHVHTAGWVNQIRFFFVFYDCLSNLNDMKSQFWVTSLCGPKSKVTSAWNVTQSHFIHLWCHSYGRMPQFCICGSLDYMKYINKTLWHRLTAALLLSPRRSAFQLTLSSSAVWTESLNG